MSTLGATEPAGSERATHRTATPPGWLAAYLILALGGLFVVHIPAFLCMPLHADVYEWDLCARTVLEGGVMYRDAAENNLPGMLWLHMAIRTIVGWSSEAIRAVDLGILGLVIILLVFYVPCEGSIVSRLGTAFVLAAFYLTTTEWCHCQRDSWMLLFALLALECRRRSMRALNSPSVSPSIFLSPLLEGLLWGAAFWLKPFVAVPALACWLGSARHMSGQVSGRFRWLILDGLFVMMGGVITGLGGMVWLWASGAWPDFWDIMWRWNREYLAYDALGENRGLLIAGFLLRLSPWVLVHLFALPLACAELWRAGRSRDGLNTTDSTRGVLLGALYMGWLLQCVALQHWFDYVHVPAILLGLTVVCRRATAFPGTTRISIVALLGLALALRLPALSLERLAAWQECVRHGSTATMRDRLSLLGQTDWRHLKRVRDFLEEQGVGDGELTCYSMPTISLHLELGRRPATRYFFLGNTLAIFRQQRARILADLTASRQRYLVFDVESTPWKRGRGQAPSDRLVFQSGRYGVYALSGWSARAWLENHLNYFQVDESDTVQIRKGPVISVLVSAFRIHGQTGYARAECFISLPA